MRRYRKRGFRTEWVGLNPVQPRLTAGTVKAAHETAEARRESPGFIRGEEVKRPLSASPCLGLFPATDQVSVSFDTVTERKRPGPGTPVGPPASMVPLRRRRLSQK
jgi:hypothetical protein